MAWRGFGKISDFWKRVLPQNGIWPRRCLTCNRKGPTAVCHACLAELEPLEPGCRQCGNPEVHRHSDTCAWCQRLVFLPNASFTPWVYRNRGRDIFHWVKYRGYWRLLKVLCVDMSPQWHRAFQDWSAPILVPMPESLNRRWRRSFNPAEQIARLLAEDVGGKIRPILKIRPLQPAMVGLGYADRRRNARRRFVVRARDVPPKVILVDDVLTTGATLEAATKTLRAAGVRQLGWFTLFRTI